MYSVCIYSHPPLHETPRMGCAQVEVSSVKSVYKEHATQSVVMRRQKGNWPVEAFLPLRAPFCTNWRLCQVAAMLSKLPQDPVPIPRGMRAPSKYFPWCFPLKPKPRRKSSPVNYRTGGADSPFMGQARPMLGKAVPNKQAKSRRLWPC